MANFKEKIGIIGLGNMGMAIMRGCRSSRIFKKTLFCGYDISAKKRQAAKKAGIKIAKNIRDVINSCNLIIIAIKPQDFKELSLSSGQFFTDKKILVSIAAGLSTKWIEKNFGKVRVIRVMPNIAIFVQEGMSALCSGRYARKEDMKKVLAIFSVCGKTVVLKENFIDLLTAVSGCGPGYFFEFVDVFVKNARKSGFPGQLAEKLVLQTVKGSAKMLETANSDPGALRDMVTSKKGATLEGLKVMRKYKLSEMLFNAIKAAKKRSKELSN